MAWRSVVITQPASLRLAQKALEVEQDAGTVRIPMEDISVLVLDQPQVQLTARLLAECAQQQIVVLTTDTSHHPNGVLLAYAPHSRGLKVLRAQIDMSVPRRKRLWQFLVQRKIRNQASLLSSLGEESAALRLSVLAASVKSGDAGQAEAQAARIYFKRVFGAGFVRSKGCLHNAALNYGYSIVRSCLARNLVAYGFITNLGLHHRSELNRFNLADDLIEVFRPLVDAYVRERFLPDMEERELGREDKAFLVNILHEDVQQEVDGQLVATSLLSASEDIVVSLSQRLFDDGKTLLAPRLLMCVDGG